MSLATAVKAGWDGWNLGHQTVGGAVRTGVDHWKSARPVRPEPLNTSSLVREVVVRDSDIQSHDQLSKHRIELGHRAVSSQVDGLQSRTPRFPRVTSGRGLVRQGFRINAVVRACTDLIAKNAVMARPAIQDLEGKPATGPTAQAIHDVLRWPSGKTMAGARGTTGPLNSYDLFYRLYQDLYTYGNAIWEWVDGHGNPDPVQIWRMDPEKTLLEPGTNGEYIKRYVYEIDGERFNIPVNNVIHWRMWSPEDDYFGVPPLHSALRDLATDNEITNFSKTTIQNLGVPPLALEYDLEEMAKAGLPTNPSENPQLMADIREIQARWQDHYSGSQRGKPAIAWGFKIRLLGMDMSQLDVTGLAAVHLNRLAMVFGVPPALLGLSGSSGGSGNPARAFYRQAREDFFTGTIKSILQRVEDGLDARLVPAFDPSQSLQIRLDVGHIDVLREEHLKRGREAGEIFVRNLATRHVCQRAAGWPVHGDDNFFGDEEQVKDSPEGKLRPRPGGEDL